VGTEKKVCQERSCTCSLGGGRAAETLTTSSYISSLTKLIIATRECGKQSIKGICLYMADADVYVYNQT